jgi:hypothetical protein
MGRYGIACSHEISPHPSLLKRGTKSKNDPLDMPVGETGCDMEIEMPQHLMFSLGAA